MFPTTYLSFVQLFISFVNFWMTSLVVSTQWLSVEKSRISRIINIYIYTHTYVHTFIIPLPPKICWTFHLRSFSLFCCISKFVYTFCRSILIQKLLLSNYLIYTVLLLACFCLFLQRPSGKEWSLDKNIEAIFPSYEHVHITKNDGANSIKIGNIVIPFSILVVQYSLYLSSLMISVVCLGVNGLCLWKNSQEVLQFRFHKNPYAIVFSYYSSVINFKPSFCVFLHR